MGIQDIVAIASQNCFVLVFCQGGYRTIIARYVAKRGITQTCLRETKYRGGHRTILGVLTSLRKYRAIWGIAAIVSHLGGPDHQSPIASVQRTRSTLAGHSAGPRRTNTTPTNANRTMRIAAQRTQGLRGPNLVFLGEI